MSPGPLRVDVEQRDRFRFDVVFDDERWSPIVVDEPEPLGTGAGPNAARLLAAAVGNCLAASLFLCMDKARVPVKDLRARVEGVIQRNEKGRFRIDALDVTVVPTLEGEDESEGGSPRLARCIDIFEDFCIVTQSVRHGIEVDVKVEPEWVASEHDQGDAELLRAGG